jgi:hypothetical protein
LSSSLPVVVVAAELPTILLEVAVLRAVRRLKQSMLAAQVRLLSQSVPPVQPVLRAAMTVVLAVPVVLHHFALQQAALVVKEPLVRGATWTRRLAVVALVAISI